MRIAHLATAGCLALLLGACGQEADPQTAAATAEASPAKIESEDDKIIYSIGLAVAQQNLGPVKQAFAAAELTQLARGFNDEMGGGPTMVELQAVGPQINPFIQRRMAAVQAAGAGAVEGQPAAEPDLPVELPVEAGDDTVAYAVGMAVAQQNVAPLGEMFNADEMKIVAQGFTDDLAGKASLVDLEEYGPKINELIQRRMAVKSETAKAAGQAFAEMAAKEEGAALTPSGLVYRELVAGDGASPTAESKVTVHYSGALIDGTVFDSSIERGEPLANYPLNQLIPGWIEGIQMMKVGGKARLTIPSELGYGDMGSPPTIPPGATLVFEVELLAVE
jgi:FKBP-type peptidyl-prolyl cis-trans isomerase FkpA